MSEQTVISSKGQVVIPKAIREAFGWDHGTKLSVAVDENGVVLRPTPTKRGRSEAIAKGVQVLSGMLHKPNRATITDSDMASIVRDRARLRNAVRSGVKAKVAE
jgi:AbrB family looped-hinge helix DNA binding protein